MAQWLSWFSSGIRIWQNLNGNNSIVDIYSPKTTKYIRWRNLELFIFKSYMPYMTKKLYTFLFCCWLGIDVPSSVIWGSNFQDVQPIFRGAIKSVLSVLIILFPTSNLVHPLECRIKFLEYKFCSKFSSFKGIQAKQCKVLWWFC